MSDYNIRSWFENWSKSELPVGKRLGKTTRNLSKRLRGKPCCGHPGEPGC